MTEEFAWIGLAFSLITAEFAYYWFIQKREKAIGVLSKEIAELLIYGSLVLILLHLCSSYTAVSVNEALEKLKEVSENLYKLYSTALRWLISTAFVDVIISLAVALGAPEATIALEYFDLLRHTVLPQLQYFAVQVGTAWLLTKLVECLIESLSRLRDFARVLTLLALVPRVRKIALPLSVLVLALSLALPFTVGRADTIPISTPPFIPSINSTGQVELYVEDVLGSPVYETIMVGLRGTNGSLFVVKGRTGDHIPLPPGNYTVLWIVNYWTNFSLHACCYEDSPYSYCDCYAYPAKFFLMLNSTQKLYVWLPVYLITSSNGTMGHIVAYEGTSLLHPSGQGDGFVEFVLEPGKRTKEFFVRGDGFRIEYVNGSLKAGNTTCWIMHYRVTNEMPPGSDLDLGAFSLWSSSYESWVGRISPAVPESVAGKLSLRRGFPRFDTYGVKVWFEEANCTSTTQGNQSNPRIIFYGKGSWNASSAPIFLSHWQYVSLASDWLKECLTRVVYPLLALYKTYLLVFTMFGGILISTGVYYSAVFSPISMHMRSLTHGTYSSITSLIKDIKRFFRSTDVIKIDWRPRTLYMETVLSRDVHQESILSTTGRVVKRAVSETPKYLAHRPLPSLLRFTGACLDNLADFARDHYKESLAGRLHHLANLARKASRGADLSLGMAGVRASQSIYKGGSAMARVLRRRVEEGFRDFRLAIGRYDFRLRKMSLGNDDALRMLYPKFYDAYFSLYKSLVISQLMHVRDNLVKIGKDSQIIDRVITAVRGSSKMRDIDYALMSLWMDPESVELLARKLKIPRSFLAVYEVQKLLRLRALDILEGQRYPEAKELKDFYLGRSSPGDLHRLWRRVVKWFGD